MNLPIRKAWKTLHEDGIKIFVKKTVNYFHKNYFKTAVEAPDRVYVDVLFVNGCGLQHPYRYRVQHQMEQLAAFGMHVSEVWCDDLKLDHIASCKCIVIYRCPCTPFVEEFIKRARYFNKTVLFDIDDLVIDTKYTDTIPFISQMSKVDKALYDDGVHRYCRTMQLCEAVITTTERLAEELRSYMPEVFINRNTASELLVSISEKVVSDPPKKDKSKVILGYFSGSITHNDDYAMILPVLLRLLERHSNLLLMVVGELELPNELKPYADRVIVKPFMDWIELPRLIAQSDINLVPLLDGIFNEAKSENKWVEAALVQVPTIASNLGAFRQMITHEVTGLLCDNREDAWEEGIERLITDVKLRKELALNAYQYVHEHCVTTVSGRGLRDFIQSHLRPSAAMLFPSFDISGGVLVALRHCDILRRNGWDVTAVNVDERPTAQESVHTNGFEVSALLAQKINFSAVFDYGIATMWITVDMFQNGHFREKYYLVQNFETDFYPRATTERLRANSTYNQKDMKYVTISRWCQDWLEKKFGQKALYAPNGLERTHFSAASRNWNDRIRILIEGDSESEYKNVDESFHIVEQLPKDVFDIWYVSYNGRAKNWYRVDKFLHRVPYEKMPEIYRSCHILLKTSILESFSYPPLEMMATGGFVVVRENEGNREYLQDEVNCLFYEPSDLSTAKKAIQRICENEELRQILYDGGTKTADERDWKKCEEQILKMYMLN